MHKDVAANLISESKDRVEHAGVSEEDAEAASER
jgi:hypothetical protein